MTSGIVYFEEIIENIKDATGYQNLRPYYSRIKRFIFNVENEIGYGGVLVLKKKEYTKGDGMYDGNRLVMPYDFVSEWTGGSLQMGKVQGNTMQLYDTNSDKIDLRYIGFLLDENGNPFTTRNRLNAIVAYAVYRLYSQQVFMKKGNANQYVLYREEYNDRVLEARGDDAWPSEADWNQLGAIKNGGAFEAMTDCGMRTIYQGGNDPSVINTDLADTPISCKQYIEAISNGNSTFEGIVSSNKTTFMTASINGTTVIYGSAFDKDSMVGSADGSTTFDSALLTSPTEAEGQIGQLVGSINGSSDSNSSTSSIVQIDVRAIGQTTIVGTITPVAQSYCYTGIYEVTDPLHTLGGVVTYIDQYGVQKTQQNIWLNEQTNITAREIISVTGAYICGEMPPPPVQGCSQWYLYAYSTQEQFPDRIYVKYLDCTGDTQVKEVEVAPGAGIYFYAYTPVEIFLGGQTLWQTGDGAWPTTGPLGSLSIADGNLTWNGSEWV